MFDYLPPLWGGGKRKEEMEMEKRKKFGRVGWSLKKTPQKMRGSFFGKRTLSFIHTAKRKVSFLKSFNFCFLSARNSWDLKQKFLQLLDKRGWERPSREFPPSSSLRKWDNTFKLSAPSGPNPTLRQAEKTKGPTLFSPLLLNKKLKGSRWFKFFKKTFSAASAISFILLETAWECAGKNADYMFIKHFVCTLKGNMCCCLARYLLNLAAPNRLQRLL